MKKIKEIIWWQCPTIISGIFAMAYLCFVVFPRCSAPQEVVLKNTMNIQSNKVIAKSVEEDTADYDDEFGTKMNDIYAEKLKGSYLVDGKHLFDFRNNGIFNGFFDDENTNVSGYRYRIYFKDEIPFVNIYDEDDDLFVSYELQFIDESMYLYYEATNLIFKLR